MDEDAPPQNGEEEGDVEENRAHEPRMNGATAASGVKEANAKRVTTPYMTKYERARVLGTRALQIR